MPAGSLGSQAAPPAHQHSSSSDDSRTEDLLQALNGKSKAMRKQEQNRQAQQRHRAKAKVCTFACQSLTPCTFYFRTVRASCLCISSRCITPWYVRGICTASQEVESQSTSCTDLRTAFVCHPSWSCLHNRKRPKHIAVPAWVQQQGHSGVAGYLHYSLTGNCLRPLCVLR